MATPAEVATPPDVTITVMKRRGWAKADIKKLSRDGTDVILKDYAEKNLLVRWLGRRQMRREIGALEQLRGVAGIPECLGQVEPCGLLLEPVAGDPIHRWRRRSGDEVKPMLQRLSVLIDAIHARGVAHLDLRKRDNVLISTDGTPSIIDFNASIRFRPGSVAARLFFPMLRVVDRAALLKWKALLCPEALTPKERRRHRRMTRLRRFWIFN